MKGELIMKTGDEAMLEYDKTWRRLYLPKWFKEAMRRDKTMVPKRLRELPYLEPADVSINGFRFNPLVTFDHVGSVKRGDDWVVITSPYSPNDAGAFEMAKRLVCELEITRPGPWHPWTVMYAFVPSDLTLGRMK
jgi:hypothetical protein